MKKIFLLLVACMAMAIPLIAQDTTPPVVSYVATFGAGSTVIVQFSEKVDAVTGSTKTNYTINNAVTVSNVKLAVDQKSAILSTSNMTDQSYALTVMNVKDTAANVMVTSNTNFVHKNFTSNNVAYYQLDSVGIQDADTVAGLDTVIFDATGKVANRGLVKNGPVISDGFFGNALSFDGVNDYVKFDTTSSFNSPSSAVSVSVWTKLAYLPTAMPGSFGGIFDSQGDQYVLYEDKGNKQLRFKVTTSGGAARPAIPEAALKTGEWINVVGVYDGEYARIYLNGVMQGILPLTGSVNKGQVAFLGNNGPVDATPFKGSIDNVQVFSKALSVSEIVAMMPPAMRPDTTLADKTPPAAVTGITILKTSPYVNKIIWNDVPNEARSVYNVYYSKKPFTKTTDPGVSQLPPADIALGVQSVNHVLLTPVTDQDVAYYYGVTARDSVYNLSLPAVAGPLTNTGKGTQVIQTAPANFVADGSLTEWTTAGIKPFIINSFRTGFLNAHVVNNTVIADSNDLSAKAYLSMDANNLYVAYDVVDDTVASDSGTNSNTWQQDSPDLNIGLYDSEGGIHPGYTRAAKPDHFLRFSKNRLNDDHGGKVVMYPGANYSWKVKTLTPGYIVEARIPFTVLQGLYAGDSIFVPKVGMTIPFDFSINDRDGGTGRVGILAYSILNNDNSWQNQFNWAYTWYVSGPTDVRQDAAVAKTFELSQNYPNPFNPTTNIKFSIPQSGMVSLKLFDILGREVMTILNQFQETGSYTATLDASKLATGVYMYKLESGSYTSVKKMMLIK
ncbi:MAG: LamG-like jellyroll fold domain-containing protein [Bacteroidota bacterium]|nr:LamG-like jellyroll fold domain-containing protein [Bacteroidota bacterium]